MWTRAACANARLPARDGAGQRDRPLLGHQEEIAGLDHRVVPDPEHELAVVDQAEHQTVAIIPDGAQRPPDRVQHRPAISLSRWWFDPTSCASMSPACGVSRLFASVDAISACAEMT